MKGKQFLEAMYKGIVGFKNFLYDKEYFHSFELPIPVLSIGNLTVGGTGKTPLTDFCLKYYQRRRLKVAVVSRNYKAEVKTIARVDIARTNAAQFYGDEPVLLAERNPQTSFFVGPSKFQTAQYAFEKEQPQLIVVDDGFQHRRLYRDVDLVILDATELRQNYRCLPFGRGREPFASLQRATAIILTKINLVSAETVQQLESELKKDFNKPIFSFSYDVVRLLPHERGTEKNLKDCAGMACILISGIANPGSFENSLKGFSLQIKKHHVFADHYAYSANDVRKIHQQWQELGQPMLITTEKDYVKLKVLWPADVPLWMAPLEVQIKSQEDSFYEILDQVLL